MSVVSTVRAISIVLLCAGSLVVKASAVAREPGAANTDPAVQFVHDFFDAFDARDLAFIEAAFTPAAKVIHDDGVVTDVPELIDIIRSTKRWSPRNRNLSGFEIQRFDAGIVIVKCVNHVTFRPAGPDPSEYSYTETWVLQPHDGRLRAIWSHYSRIVTTQHSEETNQ